MTWEKVEANQDAFTAKQHEQYPSCVKSREGYGGVLSTFFEYPREITNILKGLNRQFRQITKNKPSFTNGASLRRMLYLTCQNWDLVLSQLEIMFADRRAG